MRLQPVELAEAAVLAGVTLAFCLIGWFFPGASAVTVLGALPMAVLAHRRRVRAVLAATVAACTVGFLVVGTGPIFAIGGCALIGGTAGYARRRGWGLVRTLLVGLAMGPAVGGSTDFLLFVFSASRKLTLAQVRHTWNGVASILRQVPVLDGLVHPVGVTIDWSLRWWWLTLGLGEVAGLLIGLALAWWFAAPVIERLSWVDVSPLGASLVADGGEPPGAVPVVLRGVGVRYPGAAAEALTGVDLRLEAGEFVTVVGPNGSGKSTLLRVLAGAAPTSGSVERPGGPGLGQPGGTAMIFQRPESQVLGVRVADDIRWGLPADEPVDTEGLLRTVGLDGLAWRDTSSLSGGQLQRLAVAAALARSPRLLLSDESTAMVDAAGRRSLTALLAHLAADRGITVVHVTHRHGETRLADRVLVLRDGRIMDPRRVGGEPGHIAHGDGSPAANGSSPPKRRRPPALELVQVGHTWAPKSPWEHRALSGIDLRIDPGEGVLVVGPNGSGKSTLAWVLAGVLRPSAGRCLLGGEPVDEQVGKVALAFQHARLQLQRPTVRADVCAAGNVDRQAAERALAEVGLGPAFGDRHIDELSGGQQRRVALAGLLARRPGVLVLDEPLAGLDEDSAGDLLGILRRYREAGNTLVVVSHDLEGTDVLCDRVVELVAGEVVADGPLAGAAANGLVRQGSFGGSSGAAGGPGSGRDKGRGTLAGGGPRRPS